MTIFEKRQMLEDYCESQNSCETCKCVPDKDGYCFSGPEDVAEANYVRVFRSSVGNPYWKRIADLADKQRAKGMSKYGVGLENNTADATERVRHIQEELIDALMYLTWLEEALKEGEADDQ